MFILNEKSENLDKYTKDGKVVVELYALYCNTCEMMAPILEKIGNETEIKVIKLLIDENQEFVKKMNVTGTPTRFLYKDGKFLEKIAGYISQEEIESKLA